MSGGKFEFDDGGFYVGEWHDGEASGYGVCTGPNDIGKFEGFWENGAEVSGVYTWPNCTQYIGQWKDGQRQGFGKETFSQCEYNGEWIHGLKHGSGVIKTGVNKTTCFEGTWKCGLQDGHGVEIYKEGGFYSGQWKEGCRHGYGIRGWASIDKLNDGAVSVRQLLLRQSSPRDSCTATISSSSADLEEKSITNSISLTSKTNQLNSQSTIDLMTEKMTNDLGISPEPRPRVSVFQMVMNNFKRGVDTEHPHQPKHEFYKGTWEQDMRHGSGICFYEDGSKFVGQWKENKRHGYGLLINAEGEKSGGKWYSDSLILMTRRKNFKLPMVKKKIKRAVLDAIDASEKANKKTKLAITRGLAARKLAEEAETAAAIASGDAIKAQEFRRKFTLHPLLEASLKGPPNGGGHISNENMQSSKSTPNLSRHENAKLSIRNRSATSLLQHESIRKKSSLLVPISKSNENCNMDLLHSFQKQPVSESALYAAMDTSIGAGALSPFLSQMVLMQYSDSQTRLSNLLTQQCNTTEKAPTNALSTALVAAMAINTPNDSIDGLIEETPERSRKMSSPNSSISSRKSSTASENSDSDQKTSGGFWGKLSSADLLSSPQKQTKQTRTFLHPGDCTRKRRSGVANIPLDSNSSLVSNDARLIRIKGKMLTGDEVNYSYIALNTAVEGKETMVLYTDHPKPRFRNDVSISEKTLINSSTGLYRTLVGEVPSVLNVTTPTGIPSLDRHDSIDSGTANDDADLFIDAKGYVINRKIAGKEFKNKNTLGIGNKNDLKVTYSFSPSFEERDTLNDNNDAERCPEYQDQNNDPPPSYKQTSTIKNGTKKQRNSVSVCQRTHSLTQVVIKQRTELAQRTGTIESDQQHDNLEIGLSSNNGKTKHRFVNLLAKTWKGRSTHSIRSTSTDSGYKQSMSIDDSTLSVHLSPKAEQFSPQQTEPENKKNDTASGHNTVTKENGCNNKTSKRGSLKRSSLKKRLSSNSSADDSFDQNKTIEMSPLPERKVNLPTFCDDFTDPNRDLDNEKYVGSRQEKKKMTSFHEDFVILDEHKSIRQNQKFDAPSNLTWV